VTTLPADELPRDAHLLGDLYPDYVAALRRVQEAAVSIDMGSQDMERALTQLHELAALLEGSPAYQDDYVGTRSMALSSAQGPFSVPLRITESRAGYSAGTVRFSRFHHGRGGAAHGGATALLFDEVLGRMSNYPGEPPSRTAYLTVNYRAVAPIERDLRVEAAVDRVEGRK
jgi:acyl-coenzyme A thioesterase PaaI-like protein